MKSIWRLEKAGYLLAAVLLASTSFACGGGEANVECGENEVNLDGECVDGNTLCGPNTVYENGECVIAEPVECGLNTQLDPNTNECVVTDTVCGGHTAYDSESDSCLPTAEVCQNGTVFDGEAGLCVASVQCQAGDVAVEGFCLSPAEALAAEADVNAGGANSNPDEEGTPHTLPLGGIGETTVFTGSIIDPSEVKDGEIAQHYDFFSFSAEEGDWFEISVQTLGLLTPHFEIYLSGSNGLELFRESSAFSGNNKARQIVVPTDATVVVKVGPEGAFWGASPVGGEGWDYVGTVTQIEVPGPTTHDFDSDGNLSGTLGRLDSNFYQVAGVEAGDRFSFSRDETPDFAEMVVQAWASPTEFIGEYSSETFNIEVPASGDLFLVADWNLLIGAYGHDYELSARRIVDIGEGQEYSQTITASANDVLEIRQTNQGSASVIVTVSGDSGTLIEQSLAVGPVARYVGLDAGTYTVTYINTGSSLIENFVGIAELISPTPITDFSATYSGSADERDRGPQSYYLVEVAETTYVDTTMARTSGSGWARLFLYTGGEQIFRHSSYSSGSPISTVFAFDAGESYIIRVGNDSSTTIVYPFTYDMSFDLYGVLGDASFTVGSNADRVRITQSNDNDASVQITVRDSDGAIVASQSLTATGTVNLQDLDADTYTVEAVGPSSVGTVTISTAIANVIATDDFTVTSGREQITIEQSNDDDAAVFIAVISSTGEIVSNSSLSASGSLVLTGLALEQFDVEARSFDLTSATLSIDSEILPYYGASPGLSVPSNTSGTSTIDVSGCGTILELEVYVRTTGAAYHNEMQFGLASPAGTSVLLWDFEGPNTFNFDGFFNANYVSTASSTHPASHFEGENADGTWTITLSTTFSATLAEWALWIVCAD